LLAIKEGDALRNGVERRLVTLVLRL
jgi:hypothetical protein